MSENPPKGEYANFGGILIKQAFSRRKRSFVHALQEVLFQISHDKVVREILQDRCTAQFIADRISEVVTECANNERELYITSLLKRLQTIENVYMSKHVEKLREIGRDLVSLTDNQNRDERNRVKQITALRAQVKALQNDIAKIHKEEAETVCKREIEGWNDSSSSCEMEPHIFARVDLTELMPEIKLIVAESKSLKEVYDVFVKNTNEMHEMLKGQINKKITSILNSKKKDIAEIQKLVDEKQRIKSEYDNKIIPAMRKEFENQLRKVTSQNASLKKENETLCEELAQTKAALKQATSENELIKDTLESNEEKNSENEKRLHELENEVNSLKKKLADSEADNQAKEGRLNRIIREKANIAKNLEACNQKNANILNEKAEKVHLAKTLRSELQKANNRISVLEDENATLKDNAKEAADKIKELEEENESLKVQSDYKEQQIVDNENAIAKIEKEMKVLKHTLNLNQEKQQSMQKANNSQNIQNMQLKDQNKKLAEINEQLQNELQQNQINASKQKDKIEALTDVNEKLSKVKAALEQENAQMKEELSDYREDLEKSKTGLSAFKESNAMNEEKLKQAEMNSASLKEQLSKANNDLLDANNSLDAANQKNNELQDKVNALTSQNETLNKENETLKKAVDNKENLSDLLNAANEKNTTLTNQINDLLSVAKDAKSIVDEVQKHIKFKDPRELGQILQEMKENNNSFKNLLSVTGVSNVDDGIVKINEMKKSNALLSKLQTIFPNTDVNEILNRINSLRNENMRLGAEQKRIFGLLSAEPNVDISKTIQGLVENQKKTQEEITKAGDFISHILSIINRQDENKCVRLVFPMEEIEKNKLLDVVKMLSKRSERDHEIVENIIEQSRKLGYTGQDPLEAARIVALQSNSKQTIVSPSASQTELLKAKKQISQLRESLSKHMEKSATREEELMKENLKIRKELSAEKLIHSEISRAWTTGSADMSYLKSKLNSNEYSLISYAQQMKSMERETK